MQIKPISNLIILTTLLILTTEVYGLDDNPTTLGCGTIWPCETGEKG